MFINKFHVQWIIKRSFHTQQRSRVTAIEHFFKSAKFDGQLFHVFINKSSARTISK